MERISVPSVSLVFGFGNKRLARVSYHRSVVPHHFVLRSFRKGDSMSTHCPQGAGPRSARAAALVALGLGTFLVTACGGGSPASKSGTARDFAAAPHSDSYDKLQQEQYGTIVENPFQSPPVAPLSTFSADVNTASY